MFLSIVLHCTADPKQVSPSIGSWSAAYSEAICCEMRILDSSRAIWDCFGTALGLLERCLQVSKLILNGY